MTDNSNATNTTTQGANNSTLIEFPGVNRNRPAWRKELSERFREIQQRRARESAPESEGERERAVERAAAKPPRASARAEAKRTESSKQLGLVPPTDEPEMNPLVLAALRRIERARAQTPAHTHQVGARGLAATAAARVFDEQPEQLEDQATPPSAEKQENQSSRERTPGLAVVPPKPTLEQPIAAVEASEQVVEVQATAVAASAEVEERAETVSRADAPQKAGAASARAESKKPRHIDGVLDEFWLERNGLDPLPKVSKPELTYDDRAPRMKRVAAAFVDLAAVAALSAPFAAAIELTIGDLRDPRVYGSMLGVFALVMFLYHTCSVALAGRTWGMALCSLRAVDSRTALVPTTGQCVRRSLAFIFSLAALGLGVVYSLFDAEGRTAHDILSGTVVVRH